MIHIAASIFLFLAIFTTFKELHSLVVRIECAIKKEEFLGGNLFWLPALLWTIFYILHSL